MKTSINTIAKLAGGLVMAAASSVALASVINTPHNLSSTNTSGGMHVSGANGTTEICIFCHTPHGGNQSVNAPIWNRTVSSTSIYTRFSSLGRITFDAKEAPVGSVSIACLSCHDGTQARDAVINGPGSGRNNNQVGAAGGPSSWYDGTDTVTAYLSDLTASDNGVLSGDLIYLGSDLRNDHPISMQYGGGGLTSAAGLASPVTRDPDFAQIVGAANTAGGFGLAAANNAAATSTNNPTAVPLGIATGAVNFVVPNNGGAGVFFIETAANAGVYSAEDFPLYTRTDGGVAGGEPMVECGTCHDPHSSNSTFLRLPGGNTGSQVCLTCHAK
jgi:predicted CXXCH cytochrome family protein